MRVKGESGRVVKVQFNRSSLELGSSYEMRQLEQLSGVVEG